jgi:uncharacterized protein with GYD domain
MPLYLSRFSYTAETWARLIENPEDRRTAAESYIESVGGTLHGFWYAFGAHDGYTLWEAPDNVSMAAVGIGIGNTGSIGVLVEAVPADRIVTAMVIWSQVGIAGYLLGLPRGYRRRPPWVRVPGPCAGSGGDPRARTLRLTCGA